MLFNCNIITDEGHEQLATSSKDNEEEEEMEPAKEALTVKAGQ